jgi:hypothetical protein
VKRAFFVLAATFLAACDPGVPVLDAGLPRGVRTPYLGPVAASASPSPTAAPTPRPSATRPPTPSPTPTGAPTATPTPRPSPTPVPPAASPVLALVPGSQAADSWQTGPSLQRPRTGLGAAALDGALFALEGENQASLELLGPDDAAWGLLRPPAAAPGGPSTNGKRLMAVAGDGKRLFALGGDDGDVLSGVLEYTRLGAAVLAVLPAPVMAGAGGMQGDTLVVAGGLDASHNVSGAVQRVNVVTKGVSAGKPMPQPVAGAAAVVLDGKLYVLGGYTLAADGTAQPQTVVQVYDINADSWQRDGDGKPNSPQPLQLARHSAAAATMNGKLYLVSGAGTGNGLVDSVAIYDPVKGVWSDGAQIPTARALFGLAAFDGKLWAVGGRGAEKQPLSSVEVYRP